MRMRIRRGQVTSARQHERVVTVTQLEQQQRSHQKEQLRKRI